MKNPIILFVIFGTVLDIHVLADNQKPCYTMGNRYEVCIKYGALESVSDKKRQPAAPYGENGDTLMAYLNQNLHLNGNITSITQNAFNDMDTMNLSISSKSESIKLHPKSFTGLTSVRILDIKSYIEPIIKNLFIEMKSLHTLSIRFDGSEFKLDDLLFGLEELKDLTIDHSKLKRITPKTFGSFKYLTSLNLRFNELTDLQDGTFYGLNKLRHLSLKGNKINSIGKSALKGLNNITTLDFGKNHIKAIESGAFSGITIGSLVLAFNAITDIRDEEFQGLETTQLHLSGNKLLKVHDGAFNDSKIGELFLPGYVDSTRKKFWKLSKSTRIFLTDE